MVPHKVVLYFKAEAHELLNNGQCSGHPIATTGNIIMDIDIDNKEEAEKKIITLASEVRKICSQQ